MDTNLKDWLAQQEAEAFHEPSFERDVIPWDFYLNPTPSSHVSFSLCLGDV